MTADRVLSLGSIAFVAVALALALAALVSRAKDQGPPPAPRPLTTGEVGRALLWGLLAAVASRLVLLALSLAAVQNWQGFDLSLWDDVWVRWDAPHYLDIARYGYQNTLEGELWLFIVFFPLYPWVVGAVYRLGVPLQAASYLVSWLALAGACAVLYLWAREDADARESRRAVKYLLIFPATVFLGAPYTESLFLLLSIGCLYALRRRRWAVAGLLGMLAALTRNLGVLLALPFALEFLYAHRLIGPGWREGWREAGGRRLVPALWGLLIPLGTLIYLYINHRVYGDPFMFMKIQDQHWHQRFGLLTRTLKNSLSTLLNKPDMGYSYYTYLPQVIAMVTTLGGLHWFIRRRPLSEGVYMLVYLVMIFSPSHLLSGLRYTMGLAPLFPVLASLTRSRWADWLLTALFAAAALLLTAGFAQYQAFM